LSLYVPEHCSARDFAIVGKLAQTVFPGGAEVIPFKAKLSNFWIRKVVM
jgi:hypothetical protein